MFGWQPPHQYRAYDKQERLITIHLVRGGHTLCGIWTPDLKLKREPHEWHELSSAAAWQANCRGCLESRARRRR